MAEWLTEEPRTLWPHLTAGRLAEASRLINRAESIIRQRFPTLQERIDKKELSAIVVAGVVEDMVSRAVEKAERGGLDRLQYPEVAMEWESDGGLGKGSKLWLTTDEIVLLAPPVVQGAFSIRGKPHPVLPERNW